MARTLLVGCSFLDRLNYRLNHDDYHINAKKYHVLASCGSGNQAIAARTIYQMSQDNYDHVIVVWSGINRLDFPISQELDRTYKPNTETNWVAKCGIGSMVWHHSTGMLGHVTQRSATPEPLHQFFRTQYLGTEPGSRYLTDLSLLSIISTQAVLEKTTKSYQMAFIYDTQQSSLNDIEQQSHGAMDTTSPLYNMVDWKAFTRFESPYEWSKRSLRLESDNYHPTRNAMIDWFNLAMNIDLQT
jgi:hypothetical protein